MDLFRPPSANDEITTDQLLKPKSPGSLLLETYTTLEEDELVPWHIGWVGVCLKALITQVFTYSKPLILSRTKNVVNK